MSNSEQSKITNNQKLSEPLFDTVAIVGVGLLGGSLALAIKNRGLARKVIGVGRRRVSLDKALDMCAVDDASLDTHRACAGAQLVVVCTPAALVAPKLDEVRRAARPDAVVTDVASTKAAICDHADRTWPAPRRFIGSHPMAGSEKFGPEHATADFYEGSVVIVESGADFSEDAHDAVLRLWGAVGATVIEMQPARHDRLIALTSHLPHVFASCLANLAAAHEDARPLVGRGFRDVTRIAAARPEIWRDICTTNRDAIIEALDSFANDLERIRAVIERSDEQKLLEFFTQGRRARKKVLGE